MHKTATDKRHIQKTHTQTDKLALGTSVPFFPVSEAEADDEAETEYSGHRRTKPATRRAHIRANFEESITKRKVGQERREGGQSLRSPKHSAGTCVCVCV